MKSYFSYAQTLRRGMRRFSSSSSSPFSDPSQPIPCDVVQGPSLLRTAVHRPRPSLLFLPGLRSLPFWTLWDGTQNQVAYNDPTVRHAVSYLEEHHATFLDEYERVASKLQSDYQAENEHHELHQGSWDWHSYMRKGTLQGHFAQYFPETTTLLQNLRQERMLFEGTPFGYCFFSTLAPQSSISAHSAPMNLRLRLHLPLLVPESSAVGDGAPAKNNGMAGSTATPNCGIRVSSTIRCWQPGTALVLDDSYDHEVWNHTNEKRVVLLVDIWHPDVTMEERESITAMFRHAKEQGWWSQ